MLMMTKLFIILFVAMLMMMTKTLSSRSPLEIPTFPREESGKLLTLQPFHVLRVALGIRAGHSCHNFGYGPPRHFV